MDEHLIEDLREATPELHAFLSETDPVFCLVLGSGLGDFADMVASPRYLPYSELPHMRQSTASGHVGRFVVGTLPCGKDVLCMQGRLHGYEGYTPQEVAFPVWLAHECGIGVLFTTNAAGAINPSFRPGDFCLINDHINLAVRNPLVGVQPDMIADRFVAMNSCYDEGLRSTALSVASENGIILKEGTYLALLGPSFETPAEIRAFGRLGADTVAMSVVEEVIAARHVGMRVIGVSLVTNLAAGVEGAVPNDDDILGVAQTSIESFASLVDGIAAAL